MPVTSTCHVEAESEDGSFIRRRLKGEDCGEGEIVFGQAQSRKIKGKLNTEQPIEGCSTG